MNGYSAQVEQYAKDTEQAHNKELTELHSDIDSLRSQLDSAKDELN